MIARWHPQLKYQLNYTPYDLWHSSVITSKINYHFHVSKIPTKFHRSLHCVTNWLNVILYYLTKTIITPPGTGVKRVLFPAICWVPQFGSVRNLYLWGLF